jgi:acyl dehydratase
MPGVAHASTVGLFGISPPVIVSAMTATGRTDVTETADISRGYVDPDAVYAFARATNDDNERYVIGECVPPLFTSSLLLDAWSVAHQQGTARAVITDYRGGVHGEHDVLYLAPIRPGTTVYWRSEPRSARRTKGGVMLTVRLLMTDSEGQPLVEHMWSSYFIGGRVANEFGPDLPDHTFPEQARENTPRRRTLFVDRDQGFRYAGASGNRVTHAIDDERAQAEGYPGKILQGMCTFAMCSGAAVTMLADGEPDRLQRLACRFAAPTRPNRELVVEFYDAGHNEQGGRAVAFEALQDGVEVIKHGWVELRPE